MDDIAKHLAVSKKTIYSAISDKKELVFLTIAKNVRDHKKEAEQIFAEFENPIDQMLAIYNALSKRRDNINPSVFLDLQKSHPKAFEIFKSFKSDFIYKKVIQNLRLGKELGYYREDFNVELVADFYMALIDHILSSDKFEKYLNKRQYYMLDYHLRGIVSSKGLEYLENNLLKT